MVLPVAPLAVDVEDAEAVKKDSSDGNKQGIINHKLNYFRTINLV